MNPHRRLAGYLGLGAGLVALAFLLVRCGPRDGTRDSAEGGPRAAPPSSRTTPGPRGVAPAPREPARRDPLAAPVRAGAEDSDDVPDAAASGVLRLHGTVVSRSGTPMAAGTVVAAAVRIGSGGNVDLASGVVDDEGRVTLDVRPWTRELAPVVEIEVTLEHPDALPARAAIALPAPRRDGEPVEAAFRIEAPATRRIRGRVKDTEGRGLEGAREGVFGVAEPLGEESPLQEVGTDPDGAFELRAPADRACLVVASAPGRVPAALRTGSGPVPDLELVLEEGATLEGTVTEAVGDAVVEGANVAVACAAPGATLALGGEWVTLTGERVARSVDTVETGADGRYRVTGLARVAHRVSVCHLARSRVLHEVMASTAAEGVVPPARVDLRLDGCWIAIEGRDSPRDGEAWFVEFLDLPHPRLPIQVPASGRVRCHALPDTEYRVRITRPGYLGEERVVRTTGRGGTVVLVADLRREGLGSGALRIRVAGASGAGPAEARVSAVRRVPEEGTSYCRDERVELRDGVGVLRGLEPGDYRVTVGPMLQRLEADDDFADVSFDATIVDHEIVTVPVVLPAAGRLQIECRNEDGQWVEAECGIRAADGTAVASASYTVARPNGAGYGTGHLVDGGLNVLDAPLPAGRYMVTCRMPGYDDASVEVSVEARTYATARIVMRRAR